VTDLDAEDTLIPVRRRAIFAVLLMVNVMFLALHLFSQTLVSEAAVMSGHRLVDLDEESSFPTWWQEAQLLGAGALCLTMGAVGRRTGEAMYRYWLALGGILLFLGVDEGSEVHEGLIEPMQSAFDIDSGPLVYAWVIPGAIAVLLFALFFARFWWRLPSRPRVLVGVGGACYLSGVLGFEALGGDHRAEHGRDRGTRCSWRPRRASSCSASRS
jgi:hypothetical protein